VRLNTTYNLNNAGACTRFTDVVGAEFNMTRTESQDPKTQNPEQPGKNTPSYPARRDLAKIAIGGAAFLSAAGNRSAKMQSFPRGIKIGTSAGQPTEENMLYLKQLGGIWVGLGARPAAATAEGFTKMREEWEAGGFKVYNIGNGVGPSGSLHNMEEVTLNLPGMNSMLIAAQGKER
jgi:hypothetical protein